MINGIDLSKLQNAEYLQFNRNVLKLVFDKNTDTLKVLAQYNALQLITNDIAAMFKLDTGSDITDEILALDVRRDSAVTGINLLVDALTRHNNPIIKNSATSILKEMALYGSGIARQSLQNETATIISIVNKLTTNAALVAEVANIPLLAAWLVELKTANDLFDAKYLARTVEIGAANPDTIRAKRLEGYQAYYKLRDMLVSYFTILGGPEPYLSVINSINALVDQYNLVITQREAPAAKAKKDEVKPS